MTGHRTRTQEEWQAGREELLKEEKELTRRGDELAKKRRELPWVPVEKDYRFETEDGTKTLAELFDGRSQLLVYHFMFGPPYEAGCPVCSSIADTLDPQVAHLKAKDATLLLASRAPLEKLLAFRERMGWGIDWVSSGGGDFNRGLGFLNTGQELKPFLEGEDPLPAEQNRTDGKSSICCWRLSGRSASLRRRPRSASQRRRSTYACSAKQGWWTCARTLSGESTGFAPSHCGRSTSGLNRTAVCGRRGSTLSGALLRRPLARRSRERPRPHTGK